MDYVLGFMCQHVDLKLLKPQEMHAVWSNKLFGLVSRYLDLKVESSTSWKINSESKSKLIMIGLSIKKIAIP